MVLWLPILREVTVYDLSKTFSWRGNVTEVSLLNILKPSIAITLFSHDWLASSYHFARFKDCILMYNNLYYSSNLNNDLHLINRPSGWRLFVFALSCFLCLRWNSSTTKKSAKRNSNFTVISWKKPPTSSKPNCGTENTSTTTLPNPDTMTPSWQISYAVIGGLWNWWPVKLVVCEIGGVWNWWCVKLVSLYIFPTWSKQDGSIWSRRVLTRIFHSTKIMPKAPSVLFTKTMFSSESDVNGWINKAVMVPFLLGF